MLSLEQSCLRNCAVGNHSRETARFGFVSGTKQLVRDAVLPCMPRSNGDAITSVSFRQSRLAVYDTQLHL
jgi:hypothetical protein